MSGRSASFSNLARTGPTVRAASAKSGLRNRLHPDSKRIRSAVTNGEAVFVIGNGNSPWGRRQLDLIALHVRDLGGFDALSEAQLSLCRSAAAIEILLEQAEGQMSLGKPVDFDLFARMTGHLRRVLETLGVERKARNVVPRTAYEVITPDMTPQEARAAYLETLRNL